MNSHFFSSARILDRGEKQDKACALSSAEYGTQQFHTNLFTNGKPDQHLAKIDRVCEGRMELLTHQMAKSEGVIEAFKAADQMEWVRRMNSIRNRAEEIVKSEVLFI